MQAINILKAYNKIFDQASSKTRKCLIYNCSENCINSHILQKNGILREISVENHLIQLSKRIKLDKTKDYSIELKRVGINEAYSFPGFCKYHDTEIFKDIETKSILNFKDLRCQQLFSYRAICNELRTKEIALETSQKFRQLLDIEQQITFTWFIEGLLQGIENLNYFKKELESNLSGSTDSFEYYTLSLPKLELCITGPFNIENSSKHHLKNTSDISNINQVPFITSIVNIFPYKNNLIVIAAIHKQFKCIWTKKLTEDLQKTNYLKVLSDLILTRTEIWCASPNLIKKISKSNLDKYRVIWKKNILNFEYSIPVDFNLFDSC